jgi:hypothetical protein
MSAFVLYEPPAPTHVTKYYNEFVDHCPVTPIEYLVWHALVLACNEASQTQQLKISVSLGEVTEHINLHREQVRRALVKLKERRLAQQLGPTWVYLVDGFRPLVR